MAIQHICSHPAHRATSVDFDKLPRRTFAAGEIIRHPDEAPETVYRIEAGIVRPFFTSTQGDDALFSDLTVGDYVGDLTAIDGNRLAICYEAVTDTDVVILKRRQFLDSLRCSPDFALEITRRLCDRLRVLNRLHIESRILPMKARLYAELLRLCDGSLGGETVISPAPTHAELAKRIASQRETVTKHLNQLAKDGILHQIGNRIVVDRISELEKRVSAFLGDDERFERFWAARR